MRRLWVLSLLLLAQGSCDSSGLVTPKPYGQLVVHVYWEDHGVSGIAIEILGTAKTGTTDQNGDVRFTVVPGHYLVRAYNINRGGPCCGHVDLEAMVQAGEMTRLSVWDCLPCV